MALTSSDVPSWTLAFSLHSKNQLQCVVYPVEQLEVKIEMQEYSVSQWIVLLSSPMHLLVEGIQKLNFSLLFNMLAHSICFTG